jgi:hypothetical protein
VQSTDHSADLGMFDDQIVGDRGICT